MFSKWFDEGWFFLGGRMPPVSRGRMVLLSYFFRRGRDYHDRGIIEDRGSRGEETIRHRAPTSSLRRPLPCRFLLWVKRLFTLAESNKLRGTNHLCSCRRHCEPATVRLQSTQDQADLSLVCHWRRTPCSAPSVLVGKLLNTPGGREIVRIIYPRERLRPRDAVGAGVHMRGCLSRDYHLHLARNSPGFLEGIAHA